MLVRKYWAETVKPTLSYIFLANLLLMVMFLLGGYVGLFVGYTVAQAPELLEIFMSKVKNTLLGALQTKSWKE